MLTTRISNDLIEALRAALGPHGVLTDPADTAPYCEDWRRLYHGRLRRSAPWDCGYPLQTARMQDTAEGFGQPIRQIFEPLYRLHRELPTAFDARPRYRVGPPGPPAYVA